MKNRMQQLRKELKLSQEAFGDRLGISKSAVSNMESGRYNITDTVVILTCQQFSVNEAWLRSGQGEMFVSDNSLSLDMYAKQRGVSKLDLVLIKCYLDMPQEIRNNFVNHIKTSFATIEEIAATEEVQKEVDKNNYVEIEKELESYKQELLAEKKGLSAYGNTRGGTA